MYSSRQIDQPSQLSQHVSAEATVFSTHPQHYCMPGSQTVFNSVAVPPSPSFSLSSEVQSIPAHHSYPPSFLPSGSPCLSDSPHMIHYGINSPIIGSYPESQSSPRVNSRAGDSHVIVHHWGPVQGISGSQITVKCDIETAFFSRPGRSVTPSAGGPGQMTKTLRVVFGSYPVLTKVENLKENTERNTCFLRVTVPDWSLTGAVSDDTGGGGIVPISLQILTDDINILETVPLGHFIYTEGVAPKSNGDYLESAKHPSPIPAIQRRTASDPVSIPELQSYPSPQYLMHSRPPAAALSITGDLSTVGKGWTTEEWHTRRRLVQFWRRQEGITIHTQFRVISQSEWSSSQSSIVISCVFWEEKNSCYITSVDIIYLLEALVGTHFTVEEKNRIRRNLEGFRPITVDKSKPDTENFFAEIMNLPNPRPRNIEKNVKVYAWDCLEAALQKIIGKYSASFPTTHSNSVRPIMTPCPPSTSVSMPSIGLPTSSSVPEVGSPLKSYNHLPNSLFATSARHIHHGMPPPLTSRSSDESFYGVQQLNSRQHQPSSTRTSSSSSVTQITTPVQTFFSGTTSSPSSMYSSNVGGSISLVTQRDEKTDGNADIGLYFDIPPVYSQAVNATDNANLSLSVPIPPSPSLSEMYSAPLHYPSSSSYVQFQPPYTPSVAHVEQQQAAQYHESLRQNHDARTVYSTYPDIQGQGHGGYRNKG
ncbi:transcriptional regulator Medusa [Cryptococcus deuterogattii 99/473]|uniref:Transcriptional regulator Medusa n=1 Tax=Cryptococcus deuterogattii Ram5 TaxID=1296110 RepID=A0A0D0V315_9TREE|nr:transcriptional regulator Medusa [Cryptococcus deuterogattii LA55]KIR39320.1 transcriptional regulator Medusa [Cryptococcus deuterogattii Ram5]KIR94742.1 transcriptional regulator Medusa [Cryptococcus deuterogattii CBS 10090]KIS00733.1 transcriptional regulator Medusa [Cryptococcus deuterogattii 2001/935-1]KIY57442.1 transcriptional regulator Medusa [Cryptococcus deuterogattii 99/473]